MATRTSVNRANIAVTHAKVHQPDQVTDAERGLATEKIAFFIEKTLADAPPLSESQRDRLANLLAGGVDNE